jgi:hypothetical protein
MPARLRLVALSAVALPLSHRELARCFSTVWGTAKAVESELARLGLNTLKALIEYLLGVRGYLSRAEYRRPGEPGRPVQALVSGPPERARETLTSVVGSMSSFRLVEPGPPPVAPEPEPHVEAEAAEGHPAESRAAVGRALSVAGRQGEGDAGNAERTLAFGR